MKCNVGKADRIIRLIIGGAIIVIGLVNLSWWGVLGAIPIITSLIGWCPVYLPFKINTNPQPK
jgi:hypothetical protein